MKKHSKGWKESQRLSQRFIVESVIHAMRLGLGQMKEKYEKNKDKTDAVVGSIIIFTMIYTFTTLAYILQ